MINNKKIPEQVRNDKGKKILAFDTCLDKMYVVLKKDGELLASEIIENQGGKYHSAFLISTIQKVLSENKIKPEDIDLIGVNIGPGSFTGIRACTTVARVMAQQLGCKVKGVSSLEILAQCAGENPLVALDARKNAAYLYVDGEIKGAVPVEEVGKITKNGKYNILVSTTVVEVGVDVPNATVMVIENAERFGLSQLHQLRGRVGRSSLQSYCILVSSSRSQETRERLGIMTQTNDGFVIAEKDLQLRGPGEFLGTRQSGLPDLIISDIVRDAEILEKARYEAINFINTYDINSYPALNNASSLQLFTGLDI